MIVYPTTLEMLLELKTNRIVSLLTESTSAESSSFKDNAVPLLPLGSISVAALPAELVAVVAPLGRLPLSLSPLLRESADGHS